MFFLNCKLYNMKKLIALAFTAFILSASQDIFAQNIVLINGQPTEVTLEGEIIKKLKTNDVSAHMNGFTQERKDIFSNAKLRMPESKNQASISNQPETDKKTQTVTNNEVTQKEEDAFWVQSNQD